MPLIGFESDKGNRVTFDECWKLQRFAGLPVEILYRIYLNTVAGDRPDGLSVTECLGCPRKAYLSKKLPYYENPRFIFARFRGSMVHTVLEETNQMYAPGTIISEKRYERLVPGTKVKLSGKIDKYLIRGKTLEDYKTLDDDRVKKLIESLPEDYIWQANIYKWILEGQGIEVINILIHFISFKYAYTSGEECLIVPKWGKPEWAKIPPCPVYNNSKIEDFLYHKIKDIVRQEMPPVVGPDKRWICPSCPFAKTHCWKDGLP
jgi:CRISPR/Cas system-associated exonuclease Cas4 (RecB family)